MLDVGGGFGLQAVLLARSGHRVTVLDPDERMLAMARSRRAEEDAQVRDRIEVVRGYGEAAQDTVGSDFDVVCCHSVLMYMSDAAPMVESIVATARPGGLLSVLSLNAAAAAMRSGLQQRWDDAIASIQGSRDAGSRSVATYAHSRETVEDLLRTSGADPVAWYGVGVFSDHLPCPSQALGVHLDLPEEKVLAEWLAGSNDPYRRVARTFHILARRA